MGAYREYGGGIDFWGGVDAVVVEEISDDVIRRTVEALWAEGDLEQVMMPLEEPEPEPD